MLATQAEKPSASAGGNLPADKTGAASSSGKAEGDLPAGFAREEPLDYGDDEEMPQAKETKEPPDLGDENGEETAKLGEKEEEQQESKETPAGGNPLLATGLCSSSCRKSIAAEGTTAEQRDLQGEHFQERSLRRRLLLETSKIQRSSIKASP